MRIKFRKDVLSNIESRLNALKDSAYLRTGALTQLALMQTRIHEEGRAVSGDIGRYSKKPIYVSAQDNPGKSFGRPIGKTGSSKFKGGKKAGQDHKSRYFAGGYDEYKTAIGRNIGKVNLVLSGQLNRQLTVIEEGKIGIGWNDTEKRKRAGYLEDKYNKRIWGQTEEERKKVTEAVQNFVNSFLKT